MRDRAEEARIEAVAAALGALVARSHSNRSGSSYYDLWRPGEPRAVAIRVSDHEQTDAHRRPVDLEIGPHPEAHARSAADPDALARIAHGLGVAVGDADLFALRARLEAGGA